MRSSGRCSPGALGEVGDSLKFKACLGKGPPCSMDSCAATVPITQNGSGFLPRPVL